MRLRPWAPALITLALVAVACQGGQQEQEGEQAGEEFVIGVATGQTGYLAPYDQPSLNGFRLGVDDINAEGGIDERFPIRLEVENTGSDPAQTAVVARELIEGGINLLITPCDADPSVAAGQIAQDAGIPAISFCASTPTLPESVGEFMFSNFPGDNAGATVLANYGIDQGYQTAYLMFGPDTAYTQKYPEYFEEVFTQNGGEIVGRGTYALDQQDFGAEVSKIENLSPPPDVIMTSMYEPAFPAFLRQLRSAGVDTPILETDGIDTPTILELGRIANGIVHATAGFPEPGSDLEQYYERYEEEYGEPADTIFAATGYELAQVIDAAVTEAGTVDPGAVRDALANLQDVPIITGEVSYAGGNGMPLRPIYLVEVQGGERQLVGTFTPEPDAIPAP